MSNDERPFRSLTREERRERIVWGAWSAFVEKGLDESSMDDVAARAGTTKPTVYAHFSSKDELLAAVHELVRGTFLGRLGSPERYADRPIEAVALFCGRFLELSSTREAVGYQRFTVATAARFPAVGAAAYDALLGGAARSLEAYLRARRLTRHPARDAELLLGLTATGPVLRLLYGADEPSEGPPKDAGVGPGVDMARIRDAVGLIASGWKEAE